MKSHEKLITNNVITDNLFINFPFWFPLIYSFFIFNFPSSIQLIFLASLFLFAETHFASTWFFFFDSENWSWLKKNFYKVVLMPLYIAFLIIIIWFLSPSAIIVFHYLASGWHVTKQSTGILNIYGIKRKFYQFATYLISFSFLAIGLNNPGIILNYLNLDNINFFLIVASLIYILIIFINSKYILKFKLQKLMPFVTGIFIYMPILFFKDLSTATALGVGMHWCQYLAITWYKYLRKRELKIKLKESHWQTDLSKYIFFTIFYAFTMTALAIVGITNNNGLKIEYNLFYLIPLVFQLYHFYIDGLIWKFSDSHIRKSVLPFMFTKA